MQGASAHRHGQPFIHERIKIINVFVLFCCRRLGRRPAILCSSRVLTACVRSCRLEARAPQTRCMCPSTQWT
jgi:hypothetical protein